LLQKILFDRELSDLGVKLLDMRFIALLALLGIAGE